MSCTHFNEQNINFNISNIQLHKDQCGRCYDDQVIIRLILEK